MKYHHVMSDHRIIGKNKNQNDFIIINGKRFNYTSMMGFG